MKTVKQILLISFLAIPAVSDAKLFTDKEVAEFSMSQIEWVQGGTDLLCENAYYYNLNSTEEFHNLKTLITIKNKDDKELVFHLKEVMFSANKLQNLVDTARNHIQTNIC